MIKNEAHCVYVCILYDSNFQSDPIGMKESHRQQSDFMLGSCKSNFHIEIENKIENKIKNM